MKRIHKILFGVWSVVFMFCLYGHAHERALILRGHSGVGGEIMLFFIPVLVWGFYRCFKDTRDVMKGDDEDD